jgi:NADH-quinone oxidoreductase subunit G
MKDGVLESPFAGNLVEVCPTGVFTDKTLKRHYTRKWDLETAPSVCVHCGVGCNTIPGARYGMLRRISTRFNREVNGYFLCDRGRFGYEFVNAESRVQTPRVREGDGFREASWQEAWQGTIELLRAPTGVYAIGSPRASLESNYAVRRLVGVERFCSGLSDEQAALAEDYVSLLRSGPFRTPSLHDMESADAVLMLGADPMNEAPMVGLALQQAKRKAGADILGAFVAPAKLDKICRETYRGSPAQIADLARQVAAALRGERAEAIADRIGQSLRQAERPLIIVGAHCGARSLLQLGTEIARQLSSTSRAAWLSLLLPECNSMGVALMGGLRLSQVLTAIERGDCDTLIVLENDLFRRTADHQRLSDLLSRLRALIVVDHLPTRTAERANWVLPAPTFAEANGTLVSAEGRAQRFYQVHLPPWDLLPMWALCRDWVSEQRPDDPAASWEGHEDCLRALAEEMPVFAPALEAAPPSGFRMMHRKIPRLSERASGRTAMRERAKARIHERPPDDPETPFAHSMEGAAEQPPAALVARVWAPGWNSNEAINKFQIEVNGPLHGGDPGKRLIAPAGGPAAQQPRDDSGAHRDAHLQVVPVARIFGSDETSRSAAGLATLIAQPFAMVHPDDRGLLAEAQDRSAEVPVDGRTLRLRLVEDAGVARGVVLVPFGFPETAGLEGPANVTARSGER